jgi:hypothetical protein
MPKSYDIFTDEIDSWKGYGDTLPQPDRDTFFKMLSEVKEYSKAAHAHAERFSSESLFMALILQQQKMITHLFQKVAKLNQA